MWNKTKNVIIKRALPMTLEVIKEIATEIIAETIKGTFI
jgi:hypothetical protein